MSASLQPSGNAVPRGRLRIGLTRFFLRRNSTHSGWAKRLRWEAVGLAAAFGCCTAYVLLMAAVHGFVRHYSGVPGATFADRLVPSRWPRFRAAQGDHLIASAFGFARTQDFHQALSHARAGLHRAPRNRGGRLLVGRLLQAQNRMTDARQTLIAGLEFHREDPVYLLPVFRFLLEQQDDYYAIALARDLLNEPTSSERDRLVALAGATAAFYRGNYDQAENFLRGVPRLEHSREGRLLTANIDWDRGYRELALMQLRRLADEWPSDGEIHRELIARLRQSKAGAELRLRCIAFQIAAPDALWARIEAARVFHEAGDPARVSRELDAMLRDFAPAPAAILALADFAASIGRTPFCQNLLDRARERREPWEPHAFLCVESFLAAHDYRGALDYLRSLMRENPEWPQRHPALLDSLQAACYLGLKEKETARVFVTNLLHHPTLRAENLLTLANRLIAFDAGEDACRLLECAVALDSLNQAALTRLIELELNFNRIDSLPAHLLRLVALRKPAPDVLRVAQHKLGSDLFLFSSDRLAALDAVRIALDKNQANSIARF